jgi:hypothetical protein
MVGKATKGCFGSGEDNELYMTQITAEQGALKKEVVARFLRLERTVIPDLGRSD